MAVPGTRLSSSSCYSCSGVVLASRLQGEFAVEMQADQDKFSGAGREIVLSLALICAHRLAEVSQQRVTFWRARQGSLSAAGERRSVSHGESPRILKGPLKVCLPVSLECLGAEEELGWGQGSVFFSKTNLAPRGIIPFPNTSLSFVGASRSQSPGLLQTNMEPSPWDQVYNLKPGRVGQAQAPTPLPSWCALCSRP